VSYNDLAFLGLSAVVLLLTLAWAGRSRSGFPPRLLFAAVVLRIIGSFVRYELIYLYYRGLGDAVRYFQDGLSIARDIWAFQVSPLSLQFWVSNGHWWGTDFLIRLSAVAVAIVGPSLRAEAVLFSLAAFVGLYLIALALRDSQPRPDSHVRCAAWLWLWPSLWFWPSSVGKEAVLMLAVGLVAYGYTGRGKGIRWFFFLAGLGLAFCIRPHVTAVLAMSAVAAHWMSTWQSFNFRRLLEVVLAIGLAFVALAGMREQFGLADADLEGVKEFVEYRAEQTLSGGSQIGTVPLAPQGVPLAFINVWMRPFPWEVHNMTSAFASVELVFFWTMVWRRRRAVVLAMKSWRRHRLLGFGLPLLIAYTLMIGLAFGNLGIIARQRVLVFPFMLLFLAAAPDPAEEVARQRSPAGIRANRRAA